MMEVGAACGAALLAWGCSTSDEGRTRPQNVIETGYLVCSAAIEACGGGPGCQGAVGDTMCLEAATACETFDCACIPSDVCEPGTCVEDPGGTLTCVATDTSGSGAPPTSECSGPADCDDSMACTLDTCVAGTCAHEPAEDGAGCDDGDPCTLSDSCSAGACRGVDKDCDDGTPCTTDSCDGGDCVHHAGVDGLPCDDSDPCTHSDVCSGGQCAGLVLDCDDGNACTVDACDAGGCDHVAAADGTPCDDGNACTQGDTCVAGACASGPAAPGCSGGVICELVGSAGDEIVCPLRLARAAVATDTAVGLQFELFYDSSRLALVATFEELVGEGPVMEVPAPPGNLDTGHTVTAEPGPTVSAWSGGGKLLVLDVANPAPVSSAYVDSDGALQTPQSAVFLFLRALLLVDASPDAPATIEAQNILGTTATAQPLDGRVEDGLMVVE